MYSCNECSRTYSTNGALSRHLNNHKQEIAATCQVCKISFRRKDLLVRHARIHEASAVSKQRRRCHTACEACRRLRAKCDGQRPCASCSKAQTSCIYSAASRRLSKREALTSALTTSELHHVAEIRQDGSVSGGDEERSELDRFTSEAEAISAADLEWENLANGQPNLVSASSTEWLFDDIWPFSNAWQWTYEDLYLQEPANGLGTDNDAASATLLFEPEISDSLPEISTSNFSGANTAAIALSGSSHPAELEFVQQGEDEAHSVPVITRAHSRQDFEALARRLVDLAASATAYASRLILDWNLYDKQLSCMVSFTQNVQASSCSPRCLNHLVHRYFLHFHALWPLIVDASVEVKTLHPLLFLTLASIGALYHGTALAMRFGSALHSQIRSALLRITIESNQTAAEALDIGRAMLLTQVAALYFEQEKAFSVAQELGAKLNSQAYRMQLFSQMSKTLPANAKLLREADTIATESRLMLAFGTLRAEAFISVFFNRKPLLSYEEVNLPLPRGGFSESASNGLHSISASHQHAQSPCAGMLFSDLVRVALDEDEVLPPMKPTELELLLFGLQNDVWKFSHDHGIFRRTVQQRQPNADIDRNHASSAPPGLDLLDQSFRKMRNLIREYKSVVAALHRWRAAFSLSQFAHPPDHDRSAYLSGLILYELSFLRLSAPIESILQIVYQYDDMCRKDAVINEVLEWTASTNASESVAHAELICQLLDAETNRPGGAQAKYNILTLIAVHHAAAVIWAIAGSGRHGHRCFNTSAPTDLSLSSGLTLTPENAATIITRFADLYPRITASRGVQSSFHKIVKRLTNITFPIGTDVGASTS